MIVPEHLWDAIVSDFIDCPIRELSELINSIEFTEENVGEIKTIIEKLKAHEGETRRLRQELENMVHLRLLEIQSKRMPPP